jgi:aspartyl-tRNA(Asn)/glutamyl-tRNA(Gln) amidotransferase subunit C
VDDAEVVTLQAELNAILGYVEQLGEVDVSGVEPLSGGAQMAMRMREDVVTDGDMAEAILANAPDRAGQFFAVPKVVE